MGRPPLNWGTCAYPPCDHKACRRVWVRGERIQLCETCYKRFSRTGSIVKTKRPKPRCEAPQCVKVAARNVEVNGHTKKVCRACAKRFANHGTFEHRQGMHGREEDEGRPLTTRLLVSKAVELRRRGKSYSTISKLLDVPRSTIFRWCQDAGLTRARYE